MGVPKFFRYISERYPCLSELARERHIPEFDNLYLDMNGIIHNCSHPDDGNIHFHITEEEMFNDIFNYIDKLFYLINPKKLFFMAIDGVAPRAKMNQQRSRRFRSGKESETLANLANSRGETIKYDRFDSNCITPGTEFMDRLHEALRYFIKSKISSNPLWQKCRVILSGHNSPGEGEHKIMDYIRYLKSQSDFNPNTRHCMYGLDADLIILGLCTHELHFVVLREEVKFGRKSKKSSVEQTRFFLLHLGLMREYLELEFDEIKQQDPNFDIAKLIDDWVLMGFLVGNDFIPHLPCLHISSNALPLLYKTYKNVYSSLGGNINENGKLNLPRLEKYFAALAEVEFEIFHENHADLKYFEAKQSKNGIDEAFDFDVNEINNENTDNDLAALIESSRQFLEDDEEYLSDSEQHINDEFENYKRNYYMNKLNMDHSNSEHTRDQVICYITSLQWIVDYYYHGVQSWDWYYPHHYAPFVSDLKDFQDYEIKFNMGKPFLPFQQLLAVLPAASKNLLPVAYRDLMTSPSSDLIEYYPANFETDLNGKQHEWEAVVLIPFINEKRLIEAMEPYNHKLTPSEHKRNAHGPMLQYDYHTESQGLLPGIYSQKTLHHVFCTERPLWNKDILLPPHKTVCVKLPNADNTEFLPGFPTMKHLKYNFEIKRAGVKVFDYPSRNENMILQPESRKDKDNVLAVASSYLQTNVFIGWPHLIKAKVVGVFDREKYVDADGTTCVDPKVYELELKTVKEHLTTRMGIEFPDYAVLVHVKTHMGTSYVCGSKAKVTLEDVWSTSTATYPAQGVISGITAHKSSSEQYKKIEQLFPENSKIFFIGNPYYGSEGVVMDPTLVYECGRLKVNITVLPEPDFSEAKCVHNGLQNHYMNMFQAASQININVKTLSRITGYLLVVKGPRRPKFDLPENLSKVNIGLQFKYIKQEEELCGYAKRINNQWFLSSKAIALVQLYVEKFRGVFEYLSNSSVRTELIFEDDLFGSTGDESNLDKIVLWLKEQNHLQAEKIPCGSKTMEKESVEKVLEATEHLKMLPVKTVKLQVKPHLLLKPDVTLPDVYKSKSSIKLFDRVVVVRTTYMVPLGYKGTVVGVYPIIDPNPMRLECVKAVENIYEVVFDKQFPNGNDIHGIAKERVYKVPESSILLIYTEDNNKKDNIYNSARPVQLENSANASTTSSSNTAKVVPNSGGNSEKVSTKSWRNSDKVSIESCRNSDNASTNSQLSKEKPNVPGNGSFLGRNSDIGKREIVQTSSDDFWTPAVNTKIKHTKTTEIMQNCNQTQDEVGGTPMELQRCNDGTKVLKSLLGLSANQAESVYGPAATSKPQLPQPPTEWRNDAQKLPDMLCKLSRMPLTNNQYMQPSASFGTVPFSALFRQPEMSQCVDHLPQKRENVTQDKKFSLNSLSQKGAFIPLQVSRGSYSKNCQTATKSSQSQKDLSLDKDANNFNLNELSLTIGDAGNTNEPREIRPVYGQKKPAKIPKIGAKFDNAV